MFSVASQESATNKSISSESRSADPADASPIISRLRRKPWYVRLAEPSKTAVSASGGVTIHALAWAIAWPCGLRLLRYHDLTSTSERPKNFAAVRQSASEASPGTCRMSPTINVTGRPGVCFASHNIPQTVT